MIRILYAADRVATPWKNGGGVTREVAIGPAGATLDHFDWRVSIAEVREAGPFSLFEGIDRTLVILQGRLALSLDSRTVELTAYSAPFAFSGEAACAGRPIDGPVTDLNVMVRHGRGVAHVERITKADSLRMAKTLLVVAIAPTNVRVAGRDVSLQSHDAVLIEEPATPQLALKGSAYVIRIV